MDPALRELLVDGDGGDVLEAILRLSPEATAVPPGVVEVARFGAIRTVRLRRDAIRRVWTRSDVESLKAPRRLQLDTPVATPDRTSPSRRRVDHVATGKGVVFGCIDWGFDVFHPAFLRAERSTAPARPRVLALWDQRAPSALRPGRSPRPYGYGRVLSGEQIERARATAVPYATLGYHPGDADRGTGAHGTHVASVAAGTAFGSTGPGVAPGTDLVFVHLASGPLGGLADLGDSVRILEAVDFVMRVADGRPVVINLSVGRHGGAHMGRSLVERALDEAVSRRPGVMIVQSAGNYGASDIHASGRLHSGDRRDLGWRVRHGGARHDELEVWYSNRDRFDFSLRPPGATASVTIGLGESKVLYDAHMREIGRVYHRAFDPNSPDHHIDVLLRRGAPGGLWLARLIGSDVTDGRYGVWIERDPAGRGGQSRFRARDVDPFGTLGSIANTHETLTVTAAEARGAFVRRARFASRGPTRDGRAKPDLLAPGVRVRGARSTPRRARRALALSTTMSGASQAAPYVAGVAALCLDASRGRMTARDIRRVLLGTARPLPSEAWDPDCPRMVDGKAAVAQAALLGSRASTSAPGLEQLTTGRDIMETRQ